MKKRVELPITEPLYSTYQFQGPCTAIAIDNSSVRNWYFNEVMNLSCNRKFLKGYTTPDLMIPKSAWWECPHLEFVGITARFVGGHINSIIKNMIDEGYYVFFQEIDDYYVEGKSWYKKRHFGHDGLICGYDQNDKTYCLYSYDENWVYRKFWTTQASLDAGRIAMEKLGIYPNFHAFKIHSTYIDFSPERVYINLKEYLDSNLKKYPLRDGENVYGIVVQRFIAEYMETLYKGIIPYERTDKRVFRLIWEHKKVMLERIQLVEKALGLDNSLSERYSLLVESANTMRMIYASHNIRRRDSVLPVIQKLLLKLIQDEKRILNKLLAEMEKRLDHELVELSEK